VAGPDVIALEVFFDYQCPFVYRLAGLLDGVQGSGQRKVQVAWRYFSLAQVNSREDGWTVWGAPDSEKVHGRLAFKAAEAARRQGRFDALHAALFEARHRERLDLDELAVVEGVAERAGLDMGRFRSDVADHSILDALARDHTEGVREHGVFGTPTLLFPGGQSAYVRLAEPSNGHVELDVFDSLISVAALEPRILEIKRPRRRTPA
jgi:predicted DsbA family dithiol-disulfide isomerase